MAEHFVLLPHQRSWLESSEVTFLLQQLSVRRQEPTHIEVLGLFRAAALVRCMSDRIWKGSPIGKDMTMASRDGLFRLHAAGSAGYQLSLSTTWQRPFEGVINLEF